MLPLNLYTLAFNDEKKELEPLYRSTYTNKNLNHIRFCAIASIIFILCWTYIESIYYPDFVILFLKIKLTTIVPTFLVTALLTYRHRYEKISEIVNFLDVLAVGIMFNVFIVISNPPEVQMIIYGIIFTYVFNYTFIRSRFIVASFAGWSLFLVTAYSLMSTDSSSQVSTVEGTLIFLAVLNALGMIISYTTEYAGRREFLLEQEIGREQDAQKHLNNDLNKKINEIKTLRGIIPICANCKKIRDDSGYWNQVEDYISQHTDARFSHGICEDCKVELYPEIFKGED